MRQFVGIDLGREPVPDETTVCKIRHLLGERDLGGEMLQTVNLYLQSQGVRIRTGTIVDATIIHAPSSTKNRGQKRDPAMHQNEKRQAIKSATFFINGQARTIAAIAYMLSPDLGCGGEGRFSRWPQGWLCIPSARKG